MAESWCPNRRRLPANWNALALSATSVEVEDVRNNNRQSLPLTRMTSDFVICDLVL